MSDSGSGQLTESSADPSDEFLYFKVPDLKLQGLLWIEGEYVCVNTLGVVVSTSC